MNSDKRKLDEVLYYCRALLEVAAKEKDYNMVTLIANRILKIIENKDEI